MGARVLHIRTLLQARVMLLEGVAMDGVEQAKREVGVKIEERAREEGIGPQRAGVVKGLAVVCRQSAQCDATAVGGVDVSEAVHQAGGHQVERNLAGRIDRKSTRLNSSH